jgi:hypothetical protein
LILSTIVAFTVYGVHTSLAGRFFLDGVFWKTSRRGFEGTSALRQSAALLWLCGSNGDERPVPYSPL